MNKRLSICLLGGMLVSLTLAGCAAVGFGAGLFRPSEPQPIDVPARYTDLAGHRVAVMVAADDYTYFRFPAAVFRVSDAISQSIAVNVPGTELSLPREVQAYQKDNPYWSTGRPSFLLDQLGVERLVLVDLNEYRTHEEGNENVYRGVIDASVSVYASDSEEPDNRVFEADVRAEFPEDSELGLVAAPEAAASVEQAVLQLFALRAAGLFYDHQETPAR